MSTNTLNHTPTANRTHIGIFGKRNAGKSSLINALTGQDIAIVSDIKGTTTDPVYKTMELLPLGPVVMIDTPGLDDLGELGKLRAQKAYEILNKTDLALLVVDITSGITAEDKEILTQIRKKQIPHILIFNKKDLLSTSNQSEHSVNNPPKLSANSLPALSALPQPPNHQLIVSSTTGENISALKDLIAALAKEDVASAPLVRDLIAPRDFVVLVTPIDESAPKGRLILPQQQMIRDILEGEANAIVLKETQLESTLVTLGKTPALVITDSQIFGYVDERVPKEIPLTSFSILFARYKGILEPAVTGAFALDNLNDGDQVLISEGCTHHRQCNDIGTVKLPKWISKYTQKQLTFAFTSGATFPGDLSVYSCIVHCGGCMLNEREVKYRMQIASEQGIPMTNYGTAIAKMHGILERSIEPFQLY